MNIDLVIPQLKGSKIRRTSDGRFSVYDIIRVCTGIKNPSQFWMGSKSQNKKKDRKGLVDRFPNCIHAVDAVELGEGRARKTTLVASPENCLYIIGLLPGEVGHAYRSKAANLVRQYIEDNASSGGDLTSQMREEVRIERAKKRLLSCETNKEIAEMAVKHGVNLGAFHNSRYLGLYQSTAKELREEAGLSSWETPLDSLSAIDNTMNSLANQMAIKFDNPDLLFDMAEGLRNLYRNQTGNVLEPTFEATRIRPSQARKIVALQPSKQELQIAEGVA